VSHYLYRLYNEAGDLLYIGISKSAIQRLHQHLEGQPWADQITTQRVQRFPTREALEQAEREAIRSERPRHNISHNTGKRTKRPPQPQLADVLNVGDCVALGLFDGTCPVGQVEAVNIEWVRIRPKNFLTHYYDLPSEAHRLADIATMVFADADVDPESWIVHDDHLGDFQSAWKKLHREGH